MSDQGTTRPSPRAVERFASDLGGEVAALRSSLRHALDEADRLEAEGRPDRAADVLAEQQQLLASVHRRLEERLAGAAVEREAEGVLDAAPVPLPPAATGGDTPPTVDAAPAVDTDGGLGLRLAASAAAALVGVVLLLAPDTGGTMAAAGSTTAGDATGEAATAAVDLDPLRDTAHSTPIRDTSTGTSATAAPPDLPIPEARSLPADRTGGATTPRPPDDADGELLPLPADPSAVGSTLEPLPDGHLTDGQLGELDHDDGTEERQEADEGAEGGTSETGERDGDDDQDEDSSDSSEVGDLTGSGDGNGDPGR